MLCFSVGDWAEFLNVMSLFEVTSEIGLLSLFGDQFCVASVKVS